MAAACHNAARSSARAGPGECESEVRVCSLLFRRGDSRLREGGTLPGRGAVRPGVALHARPGAEQPRRLRGIAARARARNRVAAAWTDVPCATLRRRSARAGESL